MTYIFLSNLKQKEYHMNNKSFIMIFIPIVYLCYLEFVIFESTK